MAQISITSSGDRYWLLCSTCKHADDAYDIENIVNDAVRHAAQRHDDGRKHRILMDLEHAAELTNLIATWRMETE